MKALLIQPKSLATEVNEATAYPPLGLAYTAAFLEGKDVTCNIIDLRIQNVDVIDEARNIKPDIVGITINVAYVKEAKELSRSLRKQGFFVVLGGPSTIGDKKLLLEESHANCLVLGEGELVFWEVLTNKKTLSKVPGISYLKKNTLVTTNPPQPIKEVDTLPFPAYHLLPNLNKYKSRSKKHPVAPLLTSRGCPYSCNFCQSADTGFRARSPENVLQEIDFLVKNYGVKQLDIIDDNFTLNIPRAEAICDLIIQKGYNIAITFPNGLRADRLTRELVSKLRKAGTYKVGIGIESGVQSIVDSTGKQLQLTQVEQAISWFRKEGILVFGFFILGLPGETPATMQATIDFAKRVNPHYANFAIALPLPGTKLYEQIKNNGQFINDTQQGVDTGYYTVKQGYYSLGELQSKDVAIFAKKAYKEFYFRPGKILELVFSIRSYRELLWTINTSLPLLKKLVKS